MPATRGAGGILASGSLVVTGASIFRRTAEPYRFEYRTCVDDDVPRVPPTEAICKDVEQYRALLKAGRIDFAKLSI